MATNPTKGSLAAQICAFCIISSVVVAADQDGATSPPDNVFSALAAGYATNRASFKFGECRVRVRHGECQTLEAALAGDFAKSVEHEIHWIFDGDSVRCEDLPTDAPEYEKMVNSAFKSAAESRPPAGKSAKLQVALPFAPFVTLSTKGDMGVRFAPIMSLASLYAGDREPPLVEVDPFSIGMMGRGGRMNPSYFLTGVAAGKNVGRIDKSKGSGDEFIVTIETTTSRPFIKYWIDSHRGFETSRIDMFNTTAEVVSRAWTTDLKDFGGRWFPMRRVKIVMPDQSPPLHVTEYTVLDADFEHHPDASKFDVNLPADTKIAVEGSAMRGVHLNGPTTISLKSLAALIKETDQRQRIAAEHLSAVGPEKLVGAKRSKVWLLVANIAVLICIVAFFVIKKWLGGGNQRNSP